MHFPINRRHFLVGGLAAAAGVVTTPLSALPVANEIRVGCIGTGGRCRHLMKSLVTVPGVRIVALADVYDEALAEAIKIAPRGDVTKEYKELLDRKDVDAVLIGAPDHWHVPMTIDACAAGKHVYVEKPLTHDLAEGKSIIEAHERSKRIVQVGTQQRSMPHIARARELVQAGRLGKVLKVRMSWNRNIDRIRKDQPRVDEARVDWKAFLGSAPAQPFDPYRFRNWRWFWDFGGGLFTDLMVHWVDVAHMVLNLDHPERAVSIGNHFASRGVWETPDTVQTLLVYPNDLQMHFEGTFSNARDRAHIEFLGTEASLYVDRGRYELVPEPNHKGDREELVLGSGAKGLDFYDKPDGELLHLTNWIECVRSGKEPSAPLAAGVSAASAAHLANRALRTGHTAVWGAA